MQRAEFAGSGPYGALASKVCGIEHRVEAMTEYAASADYAKAQDKARHQEQLAMHSALTV
jgi:3,5,6-trichloropyridin-2-ol/2,4,6-trichlorophenol monooxygenase